MNKIFNNVPTDKPSSNIFDLTHDRKLSMKMGFLVPTFLMDCVPGDKISIKSSFFIRFAPLISPFMHRVQQYCHYYFVPHRLVWPNFEKFITGGEDGLDATVWPYYNLALDLVLKGTLHDYLGLPVATDIQGTDAHFISAIPFNSYQLIYKEYYRDQNLVTDTYNQLIDGLNSDGENLVLRRRSWHRDYFTSALPFTQKGPEALLPLTGTAPVFFKTGEEGQQNLRKVSDGTVYTVSENILTQGAVAFEGTSGEDLFVDIASTNFADLSQATNASIKDLRRAYRLQEYLEKNARGGSRYTEWLKIHFGVNSSDKRLNRPEYLGGVSNPVKISEVLNTTPDFTGQELPLGTMGGHGIAVGSGGYVSHYCEEHGYIIGITSVMPMSAYQTGIPRHWLRQDKFDYFTPEFQHIGEQPILQQELVVSDAEYDTTFGYTPRYAEYKFINSSVHGDFRFSLDFWHLGRKFAGIPALNQNFIEMDSATEVDDRIFAVQDGTDNLWAHILNEVKAQRPMSVYGEPKM